ncbi:MAG: GNAT family N-acetyltransferase [Ruminococcaceae bacterium]|nr:GNAT family N-acetyltransferase [Oscillospiraceae bacterium]
MKNITTKQFQILTDNQLVWDFMTETFAEDYSGGVPAPFFEYALTSSWMDKRYLHLCRLWLDGDKVAAFAFMESPATAIFFNLRPGYEELAGEMIDYAREYMPGGEAEQELVLFSGQTALIAAAEQRGYTVAWEEGDYVIDFDTAELDHRLPEGYCFADPLKCDPVRLAECMWKGFDHEDKGPFVNWDAPIPDDSSWNPPKAYNGIISSIMSPPPHSTYGKDILIANADGEYVCYAGMWWVERCGLAYMEPLCTVPEHRGKGLAAAALSELYRRLKPLGAKMMTGGGSEFYRRIGYNRQIRWLHMKKA